MEFIRNVIVKKCHFCLDVSMLSQDLKSLKGIVHFRQCMRRIDCKQKGQKFHDLQSCAQREKKREIYVEILKCLPVMF